MVKYVNNNQNNNYYVIVTKPDEETIQGVSKIIVDNKAPAICRLRFKKSGSWQYSTDGHYLNIAGYSSNGSNILITDPYIGWVNKSSKGSYYVSSREIYTATNNHPARQISY